jgi:hypothetical protein
MSIIVKEPSELLEEYVDKLQSFLETYTNIADFFDYSQYDRSQPFELTFGFNSYIHPNGFSRWYIRSVMTYSWKFPYPNTDFSQEDVEMVLNEQLIHPIVAMQVTKLKITEMLMAVQEIYDDFIAVYWDMMARLHRSIRLR